jgi:hypothetical protein
VTGKILVELLPKEVREEYDNIWLVKGNYL